MRIETQLGIAMRDLRPRSLPSPNGVDFAGKHMYPFPSPSPSPSPSPLPLPTSSPEPGLISDEAWERAEIAIQKIVLMIRPTFVADQKRQKITEYVKGLIGCCTGFQVFPYGSVPLRTYLPDGDIDLTAFTTSSNAHDFMVSAVHDILREEEHNKASLYRVKDVHRIDAEVKLVKCIVEDIFMDISFNQLGGLSTLCFLEQVDLLTGRDHLFKRSIILVKAWCNYESHILGARHGLISTYALETLVLYIFQRFHNSLKGPLGVLYTFLDYFSKFDWDNYCVSLKGPVCKSSLPDIVAKTLKSEKDLLLSEEFLQNCRDRFSLPSNGLETNQRAFPLKHLNIIDPLKENNNLGRSVNRGNFYRIRSAFKDGAHKLGCILLLPEERIAAELKKFFVNTMDWHENKCRKNVQDLTKASDDELTEYSTVIEEVHSDRPLEHKEQHLVALPCSCSKHADVDLLNLCGDDDSHIRNLKLAQFCYISYPPISPQIQSKNPRETVHEASVFIQPVNLRSRRYGFAEANKRRGTRTYSPYSSCRPYRNRQFSGSGRNPALRGHVPLDRTNGLAVASPELTACADYGWTVEYPVLESGKFGSSGYHQSTYVGAHSCPLEKLEHCSPNPQKVPETDSGTFTRPGPPSSPMASPTPNCRPLLSSDKERVKAQAYHRRNEDDFPPLSL